MAGCRISKAGEQALEPPCDKLGSRVAGGSDTVELATLDMTLWNSTLKSGYFRFISEEKICLEVNVDQPNLILSSRFLSVFLLNL